MMVDLTGLCLQSCIFQWNNQLYKQIKGCPMGFPISVVLAELSMQYFENIILVGDVITSLPKKQFQNFLEYVNSIDKNIQFTCKMETNSEILFLNLLIQKQENLSPTISVFREPTHTNKYQSMDSYNPLNHKIATGVTLFHRASTLCS